MAKTAVHFDAQTIALLKVALDEAWDRLPQPQCSRLRLPNAS